jgi:hypothetical protein
VSVSKDEEIIDDPILLSSNVFNLELDARLLLKDKALKNQELDLYYEIDKLKPDVVDYLVSV